MSKYHKHLTSEEQLATALDWVCGMFPEDSYMVDNTLTYLLQGHGNGKGLVQFEAHSSDWTMTVDIELQGRVEYEL